MIVVNEVAEKVACICCGSEKYATQSPYLCHNCWKNGEAAKLIQQLTQRAADDCPQGGSHVYKWDGTLPTEEMVECEKCGHRR